MNSIYFRVDETVRFVDVRNPNSTTTIIRPSFLPVVANYTFKGKPFLFKPNRHQSQFKNRIKMGDKRPRALWWLGIDSTTFTSVDEDRYFKQRLEGNMQWNLNMRNLVCSGNKVPHKCSGTFSKKIGFLTFTKNSTFKSLDSQVGPEWDQITSEHHQTRTRTTLQTSDH